MFTYLRNLFVLLAVVLFSACELFELPNGEKEAYVRVTPSSELIFPSSASSCSITIESSGEWTITGANEWVTVSPDRGDDGTEVIVSVAANELSEERSAELMVLCDGAEATITIVQEQKMETDYVDMAFDDAGTTIHYDAASGDMTVTYSNESNVPDVVEGSAIVLPAEYQFDIRVVESVSTSGNTISLSTSQGNMCNLFRNTSFTLSTTGDTRAVGVDGHPVIAPVAVGYLDESGKYVEVYNEDNSATRIDYSISKELWSFDLDYSGDTLWNGGGGRLWWDKCSFDAGLKGLFNFSFGEKSGGGILGKVGDLESFSYTLQGNVAVDMLMRYRYENSATFSDDRILQYNVIPTGVYTFLVNGVTVHLLVYTHLGQYVELGVEGSVEVSGGVNLGVNVEAGMSWTKDGGFETIKSATPYMNIYHPTIKAEASAHTKLSYYPQIEIGFYKFIGPWFEPRSYIKEVVSAGFRASTDGENYVAFKDEYFSGLDMRMGLKLDFGFFDKEVAKTDVFNVVDDTLLITSPALITLVSPSSGMKLEDDESVDVKFKVEAYSPVTGKYWATDNAAVVFDTESGELSDYVVLSDASGMVKVNWNPTATRAATKKHTLRATLYDIDGTVIDEATFVVEAEPEGCDDANHPHAVDLGLSVKWAFCNVGATKPEDYGDYFAWGEISPKTNFTYDNYQHWEDYDGDGTWDHDEFILNTDISGTQCDAARANWGGSWRMPTKSECDELIDNCTWTWTTLNGVKGYEFKSKKNGNSIFLPAAGYCCDGGTPCSQGSFGQYWSSTYFDGCYAYSLDFLGSLFYHTGPNDRWRGLSVRPVAE